MQQPYCIVLGELFIFSYGRLKLLAPVYGFPSRKLIDCTDRVFRMRLFACATFYPRRIKQNGENLSD